MNQYSPCVLTVMASHLSDILGADIYFMIPTVKMYFLIAKIEIQFLRDKQ